jgi:hypothetical protein
MADYRKRVYLNRGPLKVDARGITRRLQALHALGWTCADLAPHLGVHKSRVAHLMRGRYEKVFPATAHDVRALYEQLSMTVPADSPDPHSKVHVHQRARNRAKKLGYAPPLAWDDIDTDEAPYMGGRTVRGADEVDDNVVHRVVAGEVLPTTTAERHLIVTRWVTRGGSEKSLCDRMGWRHGRYGSAEHLKETG